MQPSLSPDYNTACLQHFYLVESRNLLYTFIGMLLSLKDKQVRCVLWASILFKITLDELQSPYINTKFRGTKQRGVSSSIQISEPPMEWRMTMMVCVYKCCCTWFMSRARVYNLARSWSMTIFMCVIFKQRTKKDRFVDNYNIII